MCLFISGHISIHIYGRYNLLIDKKKLKSPDHNLNSDHLLPSYYKYCLWTEWWQRRNIPLQFSTKNRQKKIKCSNDTEISCVRNSILPIDLDLGSSNACVWVGEGRLERVSKISNVLPLPNKANGQGSAD